MGYSSIENVYSEYISEVEKNNSKRKLSDGLMGFGKRADSYSCHDEFYQKLNDEILAITKDTELQSEVFDVIMFVFQAPLKNKNNTSAYWMMMAAHSLTENLFPMISGNKAAELLHWYTETYPRYERLPNQDKMLKVLKKRSKLE